MTGVVTRDAVIDHAAAAPDTVASAHTKPRLRPPSLDALFTLLFAVGGWCVGLRKLGDNSFLWHWRTGHLILDHGIPHHDVYSFTVPGAKWVAQSWLAESAYALADKLAGAFGIRVLVALAAALLTTLVFRTLLHMTRDRVRAAALSTLAFATLVTVWSERPLVFGLLGMAALVYVVEFEDAWAGRRVMWTLPIVMWLWANVHGTFSLGYVYLGLHLLGRWADGGAFWKGRERTIATAAVISVPLIAINPYGLSLLLFPVDLVRRGSVLNSVVEWMSPNFRSLTGMLFGAWLATVIVLLARHKPSRRDVIVTVPFLLLALWAMRNIGLAVLVTTPVAGRMWRRESPRPNDRSNLGFVFAIGLLALAFVWGSNAAGGAQFNISDYPVAAMHDLRDHAQLGRRLFTTDGWAGYVIAKYWPDQHVYMDDRYDMYPKYVVDDYDKIAEVQPDWKATLDKWQIDVVVWPSKRSLSQALAQDPGWKLVYHDKIANVYLRG